MFGPMTSSPKRKSNQKEVPRLPPIVSDSIWCGEEKDEKREGGRRSEEIRRSEEMRRSDEIRRIENKSEDVRKGVTRSEEGRGGEELPSLARSLEEELRHLATAGRTRQLLGLLEQGAPFVVDMVGTHTCTISLLSCT